MCHLAQAQGRRSVNPYRSYSLRVLQRADSVVYLARMEVRILTSAMEASMQGAEGGGDSSFDQGAALSAPVAAGMRKRAGDFDVVQPPSREFERIHQQIVDALKAAAMQGDAISAGFGALSCTPAWRAGEGCVGAQIRQERLPQVMQHLTALRQTMTDYAEARERLTRMLAEHSITLAALTVDSTSPF